jgi:hypothetical protein
MHEQRCDVDRLGNRNGQRNDQIKRAKIDNSVSSLFLRSSQSRNQELRKSNPKLLSVAVRLGARCFGSSALRLVSAIRQSQHVR